MRVKLRTTAGGIQSVVLTGRKRGTVQSDPGAGIPAAGSVGAPPRGQAEQAEPVRPPPLWGEDMAAPPPGHDPEGRNER